LLSENNLISKRVVEPYRTVYLQHLNISLAFSLDMVNQSTGSQLLFLSDSLSCLQSLQNRDLSGSHREILCRVHGLLSDGTSVVFMWVPGHVGLAGNLLSDNAAKAASV